MMKKGSILLLVLLVSLPGCGRKNASGEGRRGRNMAQADDFKTVNLALAQGDEELTAEERNFFLNDMSEFANLEEDFDIVQGDDLLKNDEFAWQNTTDAKQFEVVYFGYDKDKLDKKEREKITRNTDKIKQLLATAGNDAKVIVVAEGYTCLYGTDAYDLALSGRRAKTVKDQLVAAGISPDQIKVVGRGKEMPKVTEGSRDEQWANRRVEIHVINA